MLVLRVTASRGVGGGESLNLGGELRRVPVWRVADVERPMRRNNEQVRRAGSKIAWVFAKLAARTCGN